MSSQAKSKNANQSVLASAGQNRTMIIIFFFVSAFVHGLFFFGMVYFQEFKLPRPMPPVIQVDLVSFAPEPVAEELVKKEYDSKTEGISVKKKPIEKKARPISTIKPDISLKAKPKDLKELIAAEKKRKQTKPEKKKAVKKKTIKKQVDPEQELEKARQKLEEKVEKQDKARIAQALSRLQKKVNTQGQESQKKGSSSRFNRKGFKPIDLYKMVFGSIIEQNWVFNDTFARMDQNLEVRILIKILKSGEIRDIIYETRSGNRYLDESAKKAIKKANPLPKLPSGMNSYDVVVIFTPKGLK